MSLSEETQRSNSYINALFGPSGRDLAHIYAPFSADLMFYSLTMGMGLMADSFLCLVNARETIVARGASAAHSLEQRSQAEFLTAATAFICLLRSLLDRIDQYYRLREQTPDIKVSHVIEMMRKSIFDADIVANSTVDDNRRWCYNSTVYVLLSAIMEKHPTFLSAWQGNTKFKPKFVTLLDSMRDMIKQHRTEFLFETQQYARLVHAVAIESADANRLRSGLWSSLLLRTADIPTHASLSVETPCFPQSTDEVVEWRRENANGVSRSGAVGKETHQPIAAKKRWDFPYWRNNRNNNNKSHGGKQSRTKARSPLAQTAKPKQAPEQQRAFAQQQTPEPHQQAAEQQPVRKTILQRGVNPLFI